jgi:hypothetical protein
MRIDLGILAGAVLIGLAIMVTNPYTLGEVQLSA